MLRLHARPASGARRRRWLRIGATSSLFVSVFAGLSGPLASADTGFVNGGAKANAEVQALTIYGGGLRLAATTGLSLANYTDQLGQSEGRALDMGLFSTVFGPLSTCDGTPALLTPESLPAGTLADSSQPDGMTSKRTAVNMVGQRGATTNDLVGYQDATARPGPWAQGTVEVPRADFNFVLTENGRSEATTQLVNGVREAHAVVTADRITLLGGMVVLDKPRWDAVARSGGATATDGRFTMAGATILGFHRTPEQAAIDLPGFGQGLGQLLGALGAFLEFPKVTVDGMKVTVSPLRIGIRDMPLGTDTLGPLLEWLASVNGPIKPDDPCDKWVTQVADVTKDLLSGHGSLEFSAGGVEASTDDTSFTPLVDVNSTPTTAAIAPITSPPTTRAIRDSSSGSSGTSDGGDTTSGVDEVTTTVPVTVEGTAVTNTIAPDPNAVTESSGDPVVPLPPSPTVRSFLAGHKGGTASVVAFGGLALAVALFLADRFLIRRKPKVEPA